MRYCKIPVFIKFLMELAASVPVHRYTKITLSPTLRCVLQLRISRPQWVFFNGVKGQTGVIVQSDPSISINGSLLLGQR